MHWCHRESHPCHSTNGRFLNRDVEHEQWPSCKWQGPPTRQPGDWLLQAPKHSERGRGATSPTARGGGGVVDLDCFGSCGAGTHPRQADLGKMRLAQSISEPDTARARHLSASDKLQQRLSLMPSQRLEAGLKHAQWTACGVLKSGVCLLAQCCTSC